MPPPSSPPGNPILSGLWWCAASSQLVTDLAAPRLQQADQRALCAARGLGDLERRNRRGARRVARRRFGRRRRVRAASSADPGDDRDRLRLVAELGRQQAAVCSRSISNL